MENNNAGQDSPWWGMSVQLYAMRNRGKTAMSQLTRALRSMMMLLLSGAVMTLAGAAAPAIAKDDDRGVNPRVRFHIKAPNPAALQHIHQLLRQRQY